MANFLIQKFLEWFGFEQEKFSDINCLNVPFDLNSDSLCFYYYVGIREFF